MMIDDDDQVFRIKGLKGLGGRRQYVSQAGEAWCLGDKSLDQGKRLSQEPRKQKKRAKKEEEGFQDSWEMKRRTDCSRIWAGEEAILIILRGRYQFRPSFPPLRKRTQLGVDPVTSGIWLCSKALQDSFK
jgi:hypothetical protein